MSEPTSRRCGHPTPYANYTGDTPRIASVLTPLSDENLMLAAQLGITGEMRDQERAHII